VSLEQRGDHAQTRRGLETTHGSTSARMELSHLVRLSDDGFVLDAEGIWHWLRVHA
jgi:hypothetical protein